MSNQNDLFEIEESRSPFLERCAELGIELEEKSTIQKGCFQVITPYIATKKGIRNVFATSHASAKDAAINLCAALKIQFEKHDSK